MHVQILFIKLKYVLDLNRLRAIHENGWFLIYSNGQNILILNSKY